ncbi:MAG TPA: cytochrome c [Sphingobium sp.]|nr:cytochrome c [Sphingobium sp.]
MAKLGLTAAALAVVAIPASGLLADRAVSAETAAEATTSTPAPDAQTAAHAGHEAAASPVAAADPARIANGRELFNNWSCSACHSLSDAKASGAVGPSLDGDTNLTEEFIVGRVTHGQGAMPGFDGQMTPEEIADVAYYIMQVAAK